MYGFWRAALLVVPLSVGLLALLDSLDATRAVAIGAATVLVLAGVILAAIFQDRHGGLLDR